MGQNRVTRVIPIFLVLLLVAALAITAMACGKPEQERDNKYT